MRIEYVNENLLIGKWGHILVIAAFVSITFSSLAYFFSAENQGDLIWKKVGRWFFRLHSAAVVGLVILLFYMLLNHHYEYLYVFKHSNDIMPLKYILSCFWAGQEGSFLLWIICHVLLGNVLQWTAKNWEPHVMAVFGLIQLFLVSMLLGIYVPEGWPVGFLVGLLGLLPLLIFGKKLNAIEGVSMGIGAVVVGVLFALLDFDGFTIGSNPFVLLTRDAENFVNQAIFSNENYVGLIQGQGLNPLLQNYWMTIHPPTLFVGFASTLIPFTYAIAGLWKREFNAWMKPTLPWVFFGIMILGTGILMGGAWAYESLTFGGFWAWDPVENASLFPWITFVGAAHIMIIQKRKGEASYMGILLTLLSFLFVVFSTYLTRSGILADTSVHSFASGSSGQILFFLVFSFWFGGLLLLQSSLFRILFTALALLVFWVTLSFGNEPLLNIGFAVAVFVLFVLDYTKYFNQKKEEDPLSSREFWMMIGAVLLLLSCFQLIFKTSLPVWNSVFGLDKVLQKTEMVSDYAIPQMIIASGVCLVMSIALFLSYKKTSWSKLRKPLLIIAGSALLITILSITLTDFDFGQNTATKILYPIFYFAALATTIGSLLHFLLVMKGRFAKAGSALAHFGFGLLLVGAFISSSQSEVISRNTSDSDLMEESGGELSNEQNIKIEIGDTLPMGDYQVTYEGKYQEGVNVFYKVKYLQEVNGAVEEAFQLTPFIQTNSTFGRVAEPDTRHYLSHDLYTHITSAISDTSTKKEYKPFQPLKIKKEGKAELEGVVFEYEGVKSEKTEEGADSLILQLQVSLPSGKSGIAEFPLVIYKNRLYPIPKSTPSLDLAGEWVKADPQTEEFELYISMVRPKMKDFIVLKAINFPMINLLWLGCLVMILGTLLAIFQRIKKPV